MYANVVSKFLLMMHGQKDHFKIPSHDEIVDGAMIIRNGEVLWSPDDKVKNTHVPSLHHEGEDLKLFYLSYTILMSTLANSREDIF